MSTLERINRLLELGDTDAEINTKSAVNKLCDAMYLLDRIHHRVVAEGWEHVDEIGDDIRELLTVFGYDCRDPELRS